jgi:hypothetical protein
MKILLYNPSGSQDFREQFETDMTAWASGFERECYETAQGLSQRLCRPRSDIALGILMVATKEELMGLHAIRELLHDLRTILVLMDSSKEAVSKGHELQPRFLTNDLSSVATVAEKMLQNLQAKDDEQNTDRRPTAE